MEKNDFDVTESLPTTLLDSATLSISADFTCPVGQVVRGSECVACAPGNAFDTDRKNCRPCRVGTFQDQAGQTQCKICPVIAGRPGTTFVPGARSATDCKERCPAGKFYSEETTLCFSSSWFSSFPNRRFFSSLNIRPFFHPINTKQQQQSNGVMSF